MENGRKKTLPSGVVEYEIPGGWSVLAGKNDAVNDLLTFKLSKPNDYWFHVRGMPGSHVLLRAKPGVDPDRNTLKLTYLQRSNLLDNFHMQFRNMFDQFQPGK